jgi:hypothetical protein
MMLFELRVADIDNDRKQDLVQNLGSFGHFKSNNIFSPRPPILFTYDTLKAGYTPIQSSRK